MRAPKPGPLPPCDMCRKPQRVPGAVLYGPPEPNKDRVMSEKTHVCVECYDELFRMWDSL